MLLNCRHTGLSLFFKLWFGFCTLLAVGMITLMIFAGIELYTLADNPGAVGAYVGEIVKGFNEAKQ